MPIYEFLCQACHKKTTLLAKSVSTPLTPKCSFCGSTDLVHTVSSFAYHKSMQTVWEESGEPSTSSGLNFYKDPRNIGRWAEKRFKEMGQEMPPHLQETIKAAREGELPSEMKDLKKSIPDATYH